MLRFKRKLMQSRIIPPKRRRQSISSTAYFKRYPLHAIVKANDCYWLCDYLANHQNVKETINQEDLTDKHLTPLHLAAMQHQALMIPYLIAYGADILKTNEEGDTALHLSINEERCTHTEETLTALMIHNSNVDAQNNQGLTAIMKAIEESNSAIAMYLCHHNLNPNLQDNVGNTALHYWAKKPNKGHFNSFGVFHGLIRLKANIQAQNKKKQTVLHVLTKEGDYTNLNLLNDYAFDIHQKDTTGKSPLMYYLNTVKKENQENQPQKMLFSYEQFQAHNINNASLSPKKMPEPMKICTRLSSKKGFIDV